MINNGHCSFSLISPAQLSRHIRSGLTTRRMRITQTCSRADLCSLRVHLNILSGLLYNLHSLRLTLTNEPSNFVDGDLAESIIMQCFLSARRFSAVWFESGLFQGFHAWRVASLTSLIEIFLPDWFHGRTGHDVDDEMSSFSMLDPLLHSCQRNRCLSTPFTKRNVLTFGEVETETPGHLADESQSCSPKTPSEHSLPRSLSFTFPTLSFSKL